MRDGCFKGGGVACILYFFNFYRRWYLMLGGVRCQGQGRGSGEERRRCPARPFARPLGSACSAWLPPLAEEHVVSTARAEAKGGKRTGWDHHNVLIPLSRGVMISFSSCTGLYSVPMEIRHTLSPQGAAVSAGRFCRQGRRSGEAATGREGSDG